MFLVMKMTILGGIMAKTAKNLAVATATALTNMIIMLILMLTLNLETSLSLHGFIQLI